MPTLKEFPSDNLEKSNIFLSCYEHSQKQISFVKGELTSIQELSKSGQLDSVTIPTYSFSTTAQNFKSQILNDDQVYLYAKIKNTAIEQPLDIIMRNIRIDEELSLNISVNQNSFYDFCILCETKTDKILKIGKSFHVTLNGDYILNQFNYKETNKLKDAIKDLDFFLSVLEFGYFELDNHTFYINKENLNLRGFNIKDQNNRLRFLKNIAKLFSFLNISDDIDLSLLTNKDFDNIDMLITSFIEDKKITGLKNNLPSVCYIDIAKFKILVFLKEQENGSYKVSDFFNKELDAFMTDDNNNTFPISQYSILKHEHFISASNIKFDNLLPDFQRIGKNSANIIYANNIMLFMLKAYDNNTDKKNIILKVIKNFSSWIMAIDKKHYLFKETKILNNLQIIRRERNFTSEEFHSLYKITEKRSISDDILVGAFLLIGNQDKAEYYFQRLTVEEQQSFKDYPIYHFWK